MADDAYVNPKKLYKHVDAVLDGRSRSIADGGKEEREKAIATLREEFEKDLPGIVERFAQLPEVAIASGPHVPLLMDARDLYAYGYFYSCVAQCGITAERIMKDLAARHLRIIKEDGSTVEIPPEAIEHLDWFDNSRLVKFVTKSGLIGEDTRKAALALGELRNKYAHGSGEDEAADAMKAITLLQTLIDGTVSFDKTDWTKFDRRARKLEPVRTAREESGPSEVL